MEVKEILESLGYILTDSEPNHYRTTPIYRESDNPTSLRVHKKTGWATDYGTGNNLSLGELVRVTLGLKDIKESYAYLESNFQFRPNLVKDKPKIHLAPKFDEKFIQELVKDSSYWRGRGISKEVCDLFEGGIHTKTNRYYFIIRDSKNNAIGLCGRALGESKLKYLIRGPKQNFNYPLQLNCKDIQDKGEVILVEGIPEAMTLFECGIRNCLVCFGIDISNPLLSTLIKLSPKKIYLSFNNDKDNNDAGQNGAKKAISRLSRYFDQKVLKIKIPPSYNDLNEWIIKGNKKEIIEFYENK